MADSASPSSSGTSLDKTQSLSRKAAIDEMHRIYEEDFDQKRKEVYRIRGKMDYQKKKGSDDGMRNAKKLKKQEKMMVKERDAAFEVLVAYQKEHGFPVRRRGCAKPQAISPLLLPALFVAGKIASTVDKGATSSANSSVICIGTQKGRQEERGRKSCKARKTRVLSASSSTISSPTRRSSSSSTSSHLQSDHFSFTSDFHPRATSARSRSSIHLFSPARSSPRATSARSRSSIHPSSSHSSAGSARSILAAVSREKSDPSSSHSSAGSARSILAAVSREKSDTSLHRQDASPASSPRATTRSRSPLQMHDGDSFVEVKTDQERGVDVLRMFRANLALEDSPELMTCIGRSFTELFKGTVPLNVGHGIVLGVDFERRMLIVLSEGSLRLMPMDAEEEERGEDSVLNGRHLMDQSNWTIGGNLTFEPRVASTPLAMNEATFADETLVADRVDPVKSEYEMDLNENGTIYLISAGKCATRNALSSIVSLNGVCHSFHDVGKAPDVELLSRAILLGMQCEKAHSILLHLEDLPSRIIVEAITRAAEHLPLDKPILMSGRIDEEQEIIVARYDVRVFTTLRGSVTAAISLALKAKQGAE